MHFFFNFFQRGMNVKRGCLKTFETPSFCIIASRKNRKNNMENKNCSWEEVHYTFIDLLIKI